MSFLPWCMKITLRVSICVVRQETQVFSKSTNIDILLCFNQHNYTEYGKKNWAEKMHFCLFASVIEQAVYFHTLEMQKSFQYVYT
jgi:hypothetical protein